MELRTMEEMLEKLDRVGKEFLKLHREKIAELLRTEEISAEDSLKREMLVELVGHVDGICHIVEYMKKTEVRTGILERDENGEICFNGEVLPFMTELEVYVPDELTGNKVWTRAYVGELEKNNKILVGLDRHKEIKNIPARIRV